MSVEPTTDGMTRLLQDLVRIPGVSGDEDAVASHLAGVLGQAGLEVRRRGHNLFCEVFEGSGPRLLYNSHLDTVPAADGWTRPPHGGELANGRIYGLGANDARGCVVALFSAALRLRAEHARRRFPGSLWIAFTAAEETGGEGLGTIVPELPSLHAAIVGEPTGCRPVLAQKGLIVLRGEARGIAGHAAHGESGGVRNAVHLAARSVASLLAATAAAGEKATEDAAVSAAVNKMPAVRTVPPVAVAPPVGPAGATAPPPDRGLLGPGHPLLGPPSFQVTRIEGGHARNAIPDGCQFWCDLRVNPGADPQDILARLRSLAECELHLHSARLKAVETVPAEAIARAAVDASGHAAEGSRTTSDWVHLAHLPVVKIGPGDTARSHRADEYLAVEELQEGTEVYTRLARRYFELAVEGSGV